MSYMEFLEYVVYTAGAVICVVTAALVVAIVIAALRGRL